MKQSVPTKSMQDPVFLQLQIAEARIAVLESAIREHRDQYGDDRCWEDDIALYNVLGDGVLPDNRVGDPAKMLWNCARFISNRCSGGKWKNYADLEKEANSLSDLVIRLHDAFHRNIAGCTCAFCSEVAERIVERETWR